MKRKTRIFFRILAVVYLVALAVLCFGKFPQNNDTPCMIFGMDADKVAHFMMFIPFVPMALLSLQTKRTALLIGAATVLGVAIGGGIEIIQGLTGYRNCDINDFISDCIGVGAGLAVAIVIALITRKKR